MEERAWLSVGALISPDHCLVRWEAGENALRSPPESVGDDVGGPGEELDIRDQDTIQERHRKYRLERAGDVLLELGELWVAEPQELAKRPHGSYRPLLFR